jgi:membrane-associated protease RseP (regulator of RpoE activity)
MDGWIILLGLLAAHVILVYFLVATGRLQKWNLSLFAGLILMIRTQRGKGALDAIARPRRLWNLIADLGIVITFVGMVLMTIFFLWSVWFAIQPRSGVPALGLSEIFVIPGVNPFVPLWYGLAALVITLVVHEGGHGVLARANGLKVKSLGLLYAIVPIGAFVEPDELDLKVAPRRVRLRVFGAGPAVNLAFALIFLLVFAGLVGATTAKPGVWVGATTRGEPFEVAGIHGGDIISSVDGQPMQGWEDFRSFMNGTHPGQTLSIGLTDGRTVGVNATSPWATLNDAEHYNVTAGTAEGVAICHYFLGSEAPTGGDCAEALQRKAWVGVQVSQAAAFSFLSHPFEGGGAPILGLVSLPLEEVLAGQPVLTVYLPSFFATPFDATTFWILVNLSFWIFWINLMVGLTNILPMVPMDGGHIFREGVGGLLAKIKPAMPAERRDRLVTRTAAAMSITLLAAFLIEVLVPHFR